MPDDGEAGALRPLVDAAFRLAYRSAHRLLRAWWALRRPARYGVVVAIWCRGRVLMLRQSYRAGITFPGGVLRRREDPEAAARRELQEEVALDVPAGRLRLARDIRIPFEGCDDHVRVYELEVDAAPVPRPDRREVVWAGFLAPAEVLAEPIMPPYVRLYLEGRAAPTPP